MPNWCYSECDIRCKSKKDADILYDEFQKAFKENEIPNDFGDMWLGNLLTHLGYTEDQVLSQDEYACRGDIQCLDRTGDRILTFSEETAWNPMFRVISRFCDEYISGYHLSYSSEEPGMCIYISNRRDTVGKYKVDVWNDDLFERFDLGDDCCLYSGKELQEVLKKGLGYRPCNNVSLETLLRELNEAFPDGIYVNQFEYYPVEELS